jgi:hypothetical protein
MKWNKNLNPKYPLIGYSLNSYHSLKNDIDWDAI